MKPNFLFVRKARHILYVFNDAKAESGCFVLTFFFPKNIYGVFAVVF